MDLPITRPSVMSYADQLDFNELLGKSRSEKFNGFIRVTSGTLEGHILFKEGNQVAASFDRYSKIEAIEKIRSVTSDANTVIEVFDLKVNQIGYLMDVNKVYLINLESKADSIREEISRSAPSQDVTETVEEKPEIKSENSSASASPPERAVKETKPEEVNPIETVKTKEPETSEKPVDETKIIKDEEKIETGTSEDLEEQPPETNKYYNPPDKSDTSPDDAKEEIAKTQPKEPIDSKANEYYKAPEDIKDDSKEEPKIGLADESVTADDKSVPQQIEDDKTIEEALEEEKSQSMGLDEPVVETEDMDRTEIMKKYGLKDVHEEEVETLLESYKGGSLSAEDVEKVELTLMNKIKKSVLGIPKIRGAEVIVFLDNSKELLGTINIITEYESKGILSRIMGNSKDTENVENQIINLTQIEIRKSFRGYPEIVDNFEINVEFS